MTETKRYVVTMPGCCRYAVGDVVELTDSKAASFAGKVQPVDVAEPVRIDEPAQTAEVELPVPTPKIKKSKQKKS